LGRNTVARAEGSLRLGRRFARGCSHSRVLASSVHAPSRMLACAPPLPARYRENYQLYEGKPCITDTADECRKCEGGAAVPPDPPLPGASLTMPCRRCPVAGSPVRPAQPSPARNTPHAFLAPTCVSSSAGPLPRCLNARVSMIGKRAKMGAWGDPPNFVAPVNNQLNLGEQEWAV
jgi:hypothetical protein